jgi:hypothetical protein
MSAVYRSEAGRELVQGRYRELLARWPAGTGQLRVPTHEGETFVVTCGPAGAPLDAQRAGAVPPRTAPARTGR